MLDGLGRPLSRGNSITVTLLEDGCISVCSLTEFMGERRWFEVNPATDSGLWAAWLPYAEFELDD